MTTRKWLERQGPTAACARTDSRWRIVRPRPSSAPNACVHQEKPFRQRRHELFCLTCSTRGYHRWAEALAIHMVMVKPEKAVDHSTQITARENPVNAIRSNFSLFFWTIRAAMFQRWRAPTHGARSLFLLHARFIEGLRFPSIASWRRGRTVSVDPRTIPSYTSQPSTDLQAISAEPRCAGKKPTN